VPPAPERVRILCVDPSGAVLLMKWRDPADGHVFWEPPGGGIEPGETSREAAGRELYEETGLIVELAEGTVLVERDYHWLGHHFVHVEEFFWANVVDAEPRLAAPSDEEVASFVSWRFVSRSQFGQLDASLEPPALGVVLDDLGRAR
jgi:8-oxo-dGTP diphosphatase